MDFLRGVPPRLAAAAQLLATTSGYWPRVAAGLLAAVVAWQLVALTGSIVSAVSRPGMANLEQVALPAAQPRAEISLEGLVGAHLFGEARAESAVPEAAAAV